MARLGSTATLVLLLSATARGRSAEAQSRSSARPRSPAPAVCPAAASAPLVSAAGVGPLARRAPVGALRRACPAAYADTTRLWGTDGVGPIAVLVLPFRGLEVWATPAGAGGRTLAAGDTLSAWMITGGGGRLPGGRLRTDATWAQLLGAYGPASAFVDGPTIRLEFCRLPGVIFEFRRRGEGEGAIVVERAALGRLLPAGDRVESITLRDRRPPPSCPVRAA